jgi:hypothetical protein
MMRRWLLWLMRICLVVGRNDIDFFPGRRESGPGILDVGTVMMGRLVLMMVTAGLFIETTRTGGVMRNRIGWMMGMMGMMP